MRNKNKSKFSLIKVVIICLILIVLSGAGVMAVTTNLNTVMIELANGYKLTVLTSKTNVKQILEDNNIMINEGEKVSPGLSEEIGSNKLIKITNQSEQEIEVAKISESGIEATLESLLDAYSTITEKIIVEEIAIPFETVTKDISEGAERTKNKILQEGEEGIKRVTYKVKFQNETEIERTQISEEIIKEPVNKIIQVNSNVVSSRSSTVSREAYAENSSTDSIIKVYKITAYCPCSKCCGKYANGYTSSGTKATAGRTVAAPSNLPFGTKLKINGKTYVVEDRGGAIKGNRIDLYVNTHSEALAWGVKYLPVEVQK